MGRDISVVSKHDDAKVTQVRSIVGAEHLSAVQGKQVRFDLKSNKVHLFDKQTGVRIRF